MDTVTIEKISEHEDYYVISTTERTGFFLEKKYATVIPVVGDKITLYIKNGSTIRGMDLNGKCLYYKTDSELDQEWQQWRADYSRRKKEAFEKNKAQMDSDYESLPLLFRKRIDRFREEDPDFRVDSEAYELFCLTEAVKIANACETVENIEAFKNGKSELVPDLSEEHSGNTFYCACGLARAYLESMRGH